MEIDWRAVVSPHREALYVRAEMPPKSAVGALFTLVPEPTSLVASYVQEAHGTQWQLIAHDARGLAIATAESAGEWSWDTYNDPEDGAVRADWVPLGAITSIGISAVERWESQMNHGVIQGRETWTVTATGLEDVALAPRHIGESGPTPEAFCRSLQTALA